MSNAAGATPGRRTILERLAAGPISWGVCELPDWGIQLPPERVLAEMHSLGIVATESGTEGYLGWDPKRVRELLGLNGLELVGGFLAVVLHDPAQLDASIAKVRRTAALFAELGARMLCTAAVVDDNWSARIELTDAQWSHLLAALPLLDQVAAEHGVVHALHPHWRTVVERDEDVHRVLAGSEVGICLDTGHLTLGGSDPLAIAERFAHRVTHVHLKDVDAEVADRLRDGRLEMVPAVQAGLFQPLGAGAVAVGEVVGALENAGFAGWYVLEQDTAIVDAVPPAGEGPIDDVRRSIEFLQALAERPVTGAEGG